MQAEAGGSPSGSPHRGRRRERPCARTTPGSAAARWSGPQAAAVAAVSRRPAGTGAPRAHPTRRARAPQPRRPRHTPTPRSYAAGPPRRRGVGRSSPPRTGPTSASCTAVALEAGRSPRRPGRIHGAGPNSPTADCRTDQNPLPNSTTSGRANAAAPAAPPPRSPWVPPRPRGRSGQDPPPGSALLLPPRSRPHLHPRPSIASRPLSMALFRAVRAGGCSKAPATREIPGRGGARGRCGVGSMRGAAAPGPGEGLRLGRCRGRRPSVGVGQRGGRGTRPRLAVAAQCALMRDQTCQLVSRAEGFGEVCRWGKRKVGAWHGGLAGVVLADDGDGSAGVGLEGALVGAVTSACHVSGRASSERGRPPEEL